jgi:tRNA pseudouridine38-40 synthase
MERRLRLTVEYDGTDFAGFQLQGKGERTVQGELETAIGRLNGAQTRVYGAGRTDAGVHALGQVVHCTVTWRLPLEKTETAINALLPRDIRIRAAQGAEPRFHARFDATSRTYRYTVLNRPQGSALLRRYTLHEPRPLDVAAMRRAAGALTGTHDFAAFGRPEGPGKSTVRAVTRLDVRPWRDCVLVTVRGNAFLRQMVRAFVGTLLEVGRGRLDAERVRAIRESADRTACPAIAPARGLCLVRVDYDGIRLT